MTLHEFLNALRDLIEERFYEVDDPLAPTHGRATCGDVGVLTTDHTLVVRLPDGSAFTLTITKARV